MPSPGCCASTDQHFTSVRALKELHRYRRRGPTGTARRILRMLTQSEVRAETVLDVGGGVGCFTTSCCGQLDRVTFLHGDAVNLVPRLAPADLVTLDRVLCCYPDLEPLLDATTAKGRRDNARRARAGGQFRSYLHPVSRVYSLLASAGFTPLQVRRGPYWEIVLGVGRQPHG